MNAPSPRRGLRLALLLLADLALLVALAAVVWWDNAAHRGISFQPDPAPIPFGGGPLVGVNLYNIQYEPDPGAVTRSFELAAAMGARYARIQAPWEDIEIHGPGDFRDRRNLETVGEVDAWAKYDRIVAAARAADIELIVRLERPPAWARQQALANPELQAELAVDGNITGPPDNYADFARFVGAVVGRYRGQVRYFQIWNEPNLRGEWNWQEPSPEAFAELLRLAATAARAANPEAVILFPGLAPTDGLDSRAPMTELEYLDRVYRAGGADHFDIMAAQAYGLGQSPDEHRYVFLRGRGNWNWRRPVDTRNDVSRVVLLREVMEANGDRGTAVWVTEFGWNAAPASIPPERRTTWGQPVSEELKGAYLVAQLERARQEWPWMGVMNVWMLRYGGYAEPDPADPTPYFALVSRDWQILPAYEALRAYLSGPRYAGVGAHPWGHPAVEATAEGWRLRFSGTRASFVGAGELRATLNGQELALAPTASGGAAALATPQLPDGDHTIELRGPAPELFVVERSRPLGWLLDYGPLALLLALAASGAATMAALAPGAGDLLAGLERRRAALAARGGPLARLAGGDGPAMLGMLLSLLLAYRASAQLPLTALGLGLFGLLALARPALASLWVPLTLPLYFIPKGIFDARFGIRDSGIYLPLHELVLLIALGAAAAHWGLGLLRGTRGPGAGEPGSRGPGGAQPTASLPAGGGGRLLPFTFYLPPLLFLLAGIWGVAIAGERGPALRELRWVVLEPLLFAGLAWHWWLRPGGRGWGPLVAAWLAGGALAGLVGLLQFAGLNLAPLFGTKAGFSDDSILVEGVRRVTSLYGHPNNLGLAMGRYWPVAAALAHLAFWGAPPGARRSERLWRAAPALLAALLCLGGLAVSFSRGAYLGALAAGAILAAALLPRGLWRDRRLLLGLGALGGLALLGGLGAALAMGIERFNPFGASSAIRLRTWASALAMLRDHPMGIGLDQFGRLYPQYIDPALAATNEINTAHPHNLLLDIALRMGPPGLLAFGWLIAVCSRDLRRAIAADGAPRPPLAVQVAPGQALAAGLAAALAASLVHGLVDQLYFWPDLAFGFWLILALAAGLARGEPEGPGD